LSSTIIGSVGCPSAAAAYVGTVSGDFNQAAQALAVASRRPYPATGDWRSSRMRIVEIRVHKAILPLREGRYAWSGGRSVEAFDSTIVAVRTDDGRTGLGEACPLGPVYLPAYAAGVRAGIGEVGPALLGCDPRESQTVLHRMDDALAGHPFVKSALDMACWDLAGQAAGLPLVTLLGGRAGEAVELYRAISQDAPEAMAGKVAGYRAEGYRRFQLKVGGAPDVDIERIRAVRAVLDGGELLIADANRGWLTHEALRVVGAVRDLDIYVEQPCASYEECAVVRRATDLPFILDESITDLHTLLRAHAEGMVDAVNIKISKVGGLTRARQLRDLCAELGIAMTIEDSWGSDVTTAAIAHLAHSTPERLRLTATDFNSYVATATATGAPQRHDGRLSAATGPGLGVSLLAAGVGDPIATIGG
jgi:L-alanine-DL-glutamate epimerase-like enolase superfamily enzyme